MIVNPPEPPTLPIARKHYASLTTRGGHSRDRKGCSMIHDCSKAIAVLIGFAASACSVGALAAAGGNGGKPPPGTTVIDATGKVVGQLYSQNYVEVQAGNEFALMNIDSNQIYPKSGIISTLLYASAGCPTTATPYMPHNLPSDTYVGSSQSTTTSGTIIYSGPAQNVTIYSIRSGIQFVTAVPGGPPAVFGGTCADIPPAQASAGWYGPLQSSTYGPFTLPFRLQ